MDDTQLQQLLGMMRKPASFSEQPAESTETVPEFELDDDGEEYMGVGLNGILASSEKLLAMNKGLVDPDERDSLRYQKIFMPHNMTSESIKMDAGKVRRQILYRAARSRNLNGLGPNAFDPYIERLLIGNPLTSPLEEINPMQLVENARRITKMGPGGLGSSRSITNEAQAVHPSQFGFISTIEGPECFVDAQALTASGWVHLSEITKEHKVACWLNGKIEYRNPKRVICKHYEGKVYHVETPCVEFYVTPNHRVARTEELTLTDLKLNYAKELSQQQSINIPVNVSENTDDSRWGTDFASIPKSAWSEEDFSGNVYCLTVPGGVFVCRCNGCLPFLTGNSERAGIDVRASYGVHVGSNGRLYQKVRDRRTGKLRWVAPKDLDGATTKIPD